MKNFIIVGADPVIGSYLAAFLATQHNAHIQWVVGKQHLVAHNTFRGWVDEAIEALGISPEPRQVRVSIHQDAEDIDPEYLTAEEVWAIRTSHQMDFGLAGTAADFLQKQIDCFDAKKVNWIEHGQFPDFDATRTAPFRQSIRTANVFRVGFVANPPAARTKIPDDFFALLQPIDHTIFDIRERLPDYFNRRLLRISADPTCPIEIVSAEIAIRRILKMHPLMAPGEECLIPGDFLDLVSFFDSVGNAYGISMLVAAEPPVTAAVDLVLSDRLKERTSLFSPPSQYRGFAGTGKTYPIDELRAEIAGWIEYFAQERSCADSAAAVAFLAMDVKTISTSKGPLRYHRSRGNRPVLVLLNAAGNGLIYWHRLIDLLSPHFRLFIWEHRGLELSDPRGMKLDEHVEDLKAILEAETIGECVLVGWCNGPHIATEYCTRFSNQVRGLIFLNSAFNLYGYPQLNTPYKENIEPLCHLLVQQPDVAPIVAKSLGASIEPDLTSLHKLEGDALSEAVVRLTTSALREHVSRPYKTVDKTLRYAEQVVEILSRDTLAHGASMNIPALFVGCEHDQVVSADAVEIMAKKFGDADFIRLMGTHHMLYEHPVAIAKVVMEFCDRLSKEIPDRTPQNIRISVPAEQAVA